MDFSVIIQRLNELTTFMNNVRTLSKKIFQLPPSTEGVKWVAVYNDTSEETEKLNLTDAFEGMYSLTNGITAIGNITRDGADFTFEVSFEWKINGIEYANAEITRTINDAGTSNHRIDIAVCDTNNDIYIVEGFEVPLATAVVQPPTPPNTLFICSFLITESVIGDNTTPELSGQNNVPLRVEILSTDLATNDIAGFVDYVNALNPPLNVLEITSLVQYYLTDSGDIYQLVNIGKGIYGQDALQITSSNVLKFTSGNPNLPTVLAQGNRGIKTLSALTDYEFVLEDRGKRIFQTQAVNNTLNGGIFSFGDTLVIHNDCGIDIAITQGTNVSIVDASPSDKTLESGFIGLLTYRQGTTPEVWSFNKIPYEITSGGVSDGDKGDIVVSSGGTVWTIASALKSAWDGAVSWISTNGTNILNHLSSTSNPHNVTKTQVGLGNVDNTSDANKPISIAQLAEFNTKDVLPVLYEKHANVPIFGSASLNNLEGVSFVIAGGTARTFADTNDYTRRQRLGLTVAATGNLGQARQTITYFNRNSNLNVLIGMGFAENCNNANVRAFAGVSANTIFSNVEPTALTNCFGIAKLTTSNNLHLVHNDGSGTATAVDLGASFPTNTIETDFYLLEVKTNGSNLDYVVTRVNTGDTASGSISTDIPATTQALNMGMYVVQSTGANTTTGIDYFGTNLIKS